jgi:hypothetical protein
MMPGDDEGRPPPGDEPAHIEALRPTEPPISSDSTPEHRQNINYAAALELAAATWEVFPCWWAGPRAKSPITKHGHLEATTNPDKIKLWWEKWPRAMIGAKVPDSLLPLDLDPRNGGSLRALTDLVGDLPDRLTAWSGRNDGGRHLYFLRPPGPLTSTRLPEGIDLKINGYMIMPPSIHPATGEPYRWEDHPVASLPYRLRELLRPAPQPVRTYRGGSSKASAGLVRTVANAAVGQRNRILFWASCRAAEKGLIDQIEDELVVAALTNGLTEAAARRTVASARRTTS